MQKTLITLAIIASLGALNGCGSSDSGGGGVTASNYSGTVNKGIVSNGKVEICEVFADTGCTDKNGDSYYVETETTEDGSYEVTGSPMGSPLLVLVSKKDANTTMMCDLQSCVSDSGTVSFGESFVVDDDWSLQAIIPATNSGTQTVNVTSLTDMAAAEAIEVAGNGKVTEAIATNANNAVKAAFGLTKSITEIGALDLTDEDAVATALLGDSEEFMAASYSASSYNLDKSTLMTFDSSTGGYTIASTEINNIMTDALDLLTIVETKTNEKLKEANPDAEEVSLTSTKSEITAAIDDTPSSVGAIEASEELVAAKEFITSIRTTYNSVQDDGDLRTGLNDFSDEFNGIDDLVSVDLDSIAEHLSFAVTAIAEAVDEGEEDSYEASNGYTVIIENDTYSVDEENGDVVVEAVVTGTDSITDDVTKVYCEDEAFSESEPYICGETWESSAGNVALTLSTVEIKEGDTLLSATGSASASDFNSEGGWSDTSDGDWSEVENENMTLDKANIALDAELTYVSDTSEASFVGKITLDLKDLAFTEAQTFQQNYTETGYNGSDTEEITLDAGEMSILFDGELTANDETSGVYLSLVADNSLGYSHNENWSSAWEYMWDSGTYSYSDESSNSEETSTSYVKLHAIARVTTDIVDAENNDMAASVELKADRNSFDAVDTSITINYNDIDVILEADIGLYDTANSDLIVRNTTGAVATINALDDNDDKFEGTLTINNVETASIEETDAGLVLIRYTDGTFESLF